MKIYLVGQSGLLGGCLKREALFRSIDVLSIGRTISDPSADIKLDLSRISDIEKHLDPVARGDSDDVAILNSGVLGKVALAGELESEEITDVFNINALSNILIFKKLYRAGLRRFIVISSGAAQKKYKGWFLYCLSKELQQSIWKTLASDYTDIAVLLVAPGVLASSMHDFTDSIERGTFPDLNKFYEIRENNLYQDPDVSARKIIDLISKGDFSESGFEYIDIRDYE